MSDELQSPAPDLSAAHRAGCAGAARRRSTIRRFFSLGNFLSVTADTMTLFLMASGVTFVIIIGGIDLSIQAVASMASCILAAYLRALRFLADPACGARRGGCGFCRQHRLDQAADPLLHRHACRERRRDCRPATGFPDTRSINIPADLRASYLVLGGRRHVRRSQ